MKNEKSTLKTVLIILGIIAVILIAVILYLLIINNRSKDDKIMLEDPSQTIVSSLEESQKPEKSSEKEKEEEKGNLNEEKSKEENTIKEDPGNSLNSNNEDEEEPEKIELSRDEMDAFWIRNGGYWRSVTYDVPFDNAKKADNFFVGYFVAEAEYIIEYGIYETSYWLAGEVIKAYKTGDGNTFEFTIRIPAFDGNEMEDPRPERIEIIYIHEISNFSTIKIEYIGESEYYAYEYGGQTIEEAFS